MHMRTLISTLAALALIAGISAAVAQQEARSSAPDITVAPCSDFPDHVPAYSYRTVCITDDGQLYQIPGK